MQHSVKDMAMVAAMMFEQGRNQEAFDVCCVALKDRHAPHIFKLILAQVASKIDIRSFNPVIKNSLFYAIDAEGIDAQKLSIPWIKMLRQDPLFDPVFAYSEKDYVYSPSDWKNFQACLDESFFVAGLKNLIIDCDAIEISLRNIRKALLLNIIDEGGFKKRHLEFICALAEQCYNNEYVYYVTEEENQKLVALSFDDPYAVAVSACYESLQGKNFNQKISAVPAFKRLMQIQIKEPEREQELKETINILGKIEDSVSIDVRNMYEKNPYPRWRSIDIPVAKQSEIKAEILVAGSGTGRYAIQAAIVLPNAMIQAIDISLSSLAYAKRMAQYYEADNIDFAQCDILKLDNLDRSFDFINCSGVLHHMADPVAGWKSILRRLKPGGLMTIGLYSTKAREVIFKGREAILKAGFKPDDEGIRAFREYVFSLPQEDPRFHRLRAFKDFYTMSEVRDLLFHVQEATYTIPQLREIFEELGLEFLRFRVPSPKIGKIYEEKFPDDPDMKNLDHWSNIEDQIPDMFGEMYNFLCKRKDDTIVNINANRLIETNIFL